MDKLTRMAFRLADEGSKSILDSCLPTVQLGGFEWRDSERPYQPAEWHVHRAIRYLGARGMLIRHHERKGLIRWKQRTWTGNRREMKRKRNERRNIGK